MSKNNYLPQYVYENNTKLNIKHFDINNRNILKYLLFNFSESDFCSEEHHNGLFNQNNLKVNYEKLNEFIDSLGESWYGANPLNLTLPIKRLQLIGLPGVISNELPKKVNKLIDFRGDSNKLQNKYVKPIFDIGFTYLFKLY